MCDLSDHNGIFDCDWIDLEHEQYERYKLLRYFGLFIYFIQCILPFQPISYSSDYNPSQYFFCDSTVLVAGRTCENIFELILILVFRYQISVCLSFC